MGWPLSVQAPAHSRGMTSARSEKFLTARLSSTSWPQSKSLEAWLFNGKERLGPVLRV
jgi:hypothetical protein